MLRCDLHRHLYGSVQAAWWLEHIARRGADLSAYEGAYITAFGQPSGLREILQRHRNGEHSALLDFQKLFTMGADCPPGFERFQAKHNLLTWSSALADPTLLRRPTTHAQDELRALLAAVAEDCRRDGLQVVELRIMLPAGLRTAVARWLWEVIAEQCANLSNEACAIYAVASLPRNSALGAWQPLAELLRAGQGQHIVAVDLCHREETSEPADLKPLSEAIHAFNAHHPRQAVALLTHVGESYANISLEGALRRIQQSVSLLKAHRLGHAIAAGIHPAHHGVHERRESVADRRRQITWDIAHADELRAAGITIDPDSLRAEERQLEGVDPQHIIHHHYDEERMQQWALRQQWLRRFLAESQTVVEVCPSSNQRIAGIRNPQHHSIHAFIRDGLRCVLGSDDPGLFAQPFSAEEKLLADWLGNSAQAAALVHSGDCQSIVLSGRYPAAPGPRQGHGPNAELMH